MRYSNTLLTFESNDSTHPSEDDLEEFVFGRLDGDALEEVEEHLLACETCRKRLAETETFIASTRAATRKMLGAPQPQPKPRRFSAPALALAAVLGVALLIGYVSVLPSFRAPQSLTLVAERSGVPAQAQSGRPLELRLDLSGANDGEVRWLEIVDSQGARLHSAAVSLANGVVLHKTPPLPPGQAWIRLYVQPSPSAQATPLREYNLVVE
jgi:hypothetical protein